MARPRRPVEARFHERLIPGAPDECWEWPGKRRSFGKRGGIGYGIICIGSRPAIEVATHRLAYELHHGVKLTNEQFVCHRCDNPPCCNPAHLFLGTQADNLRDRNGKGRANMPKGGAHHRATVTEDDVRWIRAEAAKRPRSVRQIAFALGMPYNTVWSIVKRISWNHIP